LLAATIVGRRWPVAGVVVRAVGRCLRTQEAGMIAFLGMGLLGSNFTRALRKRGEEVRVWNRTAEKARPLAEIGAVVCEDLATAVRGASRVHLVLSDDQAVDDVLERARPGFEKDVIIVDHTTTTASGTRERAKRWAERKVSFQHAPVFMAPQNALESTGVMLASGERARFEKLEPELAKMTGKVMYLGDDPGRAAAFKLLGNSFLMFMTAGFADFFELGKAMGISSSDAAGLFKFFNPGATLPGRVERILADKFSDPSWELAMARKDARLMIEETERGGGSLAVLPAIAKTMDEYIARGHAHDDWTIIAKDSLLK
jgi:3-hydroxyisobutyrate dehydrogenase